MGHVYNNPTFKVVSMQVCYIPNVPNIRIDIKSI